MREALRQLGRLWLIFSLALMPLAPGQAALLSAPSAAPSAAPSSAPVPFAAESAPGTAQRCAHGERTQASVGVAASRASARSSAACCGDAVCDMDPNAETCHCPSTAQGAVALPDRHPLPLHPVHEAPTSRPSHYADSIPPPAFRPPIA